MDTWPCADQNTNSADSGILLQYICDYNYMSILRFLSHKGTLVICNLSSVLKDPSQWENPDQFYPEHFLDDQRNFRKREAFYPFSAGRLSLYFTHTYDWCFNVRWHLHTWVLPLHLSREKVMSGWAAGTKCTLPVLHFPPPEVLILSSWRTRTSL